MAFGFWKKKKKVIQNRTVSTKTYGFERKDINAAVMLIELRRNDQVRANKVMLVGGQFLAVAAGSFLVHLVSIYNVVLLWLDAPKTTLGLLMSTGGSIFLLLKSNRRTVPVAQDLTNKGYTVIQDSFGDWWMLQTTDGTAERLVIPK